MTNRLRLLLICFFAAMRQLPGIQRASGNVMSENRQAVREHVTERFYSPPATGRLLRLERGTGFNVRVLLHLLNPVPQLRAVDHRDSNDDSYFRGNPIIRQHFCEHPLPEAYTLLVDTLTVRCNAQLVAAQVLRVKLRRLIRPCVSFDTQGELASCFRKLVFFLLTS